MKVKSKKRKPTTLRRPAVVVQLLYPLEITDDAQSDNNTGDNTELAADEDSGDDL